MSLNVLFIGGTGNISLPCVERALSQGHKVSVFNRGNSELPAGVTSIVGDMSDAAAYAKLGDNGYDTVCQFIAFSPEQVQQDIDTFAGKVGQYIFISSASIYEKPARHYMITEETPTINPHWHYSRQKIACETLLRNSNNFNWTVVRPSHTMRTILPAMMDQGDALGNRMMTGKPILVCGDGMGPWTLTRPVDFAVPFVGLFGKSDALGEAFHITSDRGYAWNDIYRTIAAGLGVEVEIVHVPTDTLLAYNPAWEGSLMGDKSWPALFDNSKVKRVAGDFTCSEILSEVLAGPIASFKARYAKDGGQAGEFDTIIDRIAAEQSALGK